MKDWRKLRIGDSILFYGKEFDGIFKEEGFVKNVYADHVIVEANEMSLWLDDSTEKLFFKLRRD